MSAATQQSIRELTPRDRPRVILATLLRTIVTTALLFTIYALVPLDSFTSPDTPIRLIIVLIILPLVFGVQIRAIRSASYPDLRATESVITGILVFVVLFALVYLGLGLSSPASFLSTAEPYCCDPLHRHHSVDGRLRRYHCSVGRRHTDRDDPDAA